MEMHEFFYMRFPDSETLGEYFKSLSAEEQATIKAFVTQMMSEEKKKQDKWNKESDEKWREANKEWRDEKGNIKCHYSDPSFDE